jgi:stalled ribosome alternative rescue factor ArfA
LSALFSGGGKIVDNDIGVWRSREDAHRGGTGPWHRKARGAAREMYEKIVFTTMELVVGDEVGEWSFGEWTG